jgi:hypothetical protein
MENQKDEWGVPYLKYYTPEIIEFRPLFEYEWLNNKGEWQKHRFRTDSKNNSEKYNIPDNKEFIDGDKNLHRQIFKYIEEGRIRVKYLDKEDIVDLGLEIVPNEKKSIFVDFIGSITIMKRQFDVKLSFMPPTIIVGSEPLAMMRALENPTYSDASVLLEGRVHEKFPYVTIYNDCIKNKSELKILLKKERSNMTIAPPNPTNN